MRWVEVEQIYIYQLNVILTAVMNLCICLQVTSAIPKYRSGILAAVSGPLFFVEKVRIFHDYYFSVA